ncbi:hypothetical protein MMC07_006396 [Pseudocyphellaria aurata]|nr:hypothetical protein [Pseudocyphellaria aurata]
MLCWVSLLLLWVKLPDTADAVVTVLSDSPPDTTGADAADADAADKDAADEDAADKDTANIDPQPASTAESADAEDAGDTSDVSGMISSDCTASIADPAGKLHLMTQRRRIPSLGWPIYCVLWGRPVANYARTRSLWRHPWHQHPIS